MQSNKKPHKSPQHTTTYKSPYFSSVHRNRQHQQNHPNKNRVTASAQNALHITKYPSLNNGYEGGGGQGYDANKKKVFKRFNKFQQIDQIYGYQINLGKKSNQRKQKQQPLTTSSNPKQILYSNKTLALMQKYSSYKSILLSTPKIRTKSKQTRQQKQSRDHSLSIRRHSNFRMKVKTGNTIQWANSANNIGRGQEDADQQQQMQDYKDNNQDWLCQQLIRNQVYGVDEDDF